MALEFDGNQYLSLASAVATQPIAMSCWVKLPPSAANNGFWEIGTGGGNDRYTLISNSQEARVYTVRQFSSATMNGVSAELTNVWQHILCWSNSPTDHGSYLDAASLITSAVSQTPAATQTTIAAKTNGVELLIGAICEVAFWNISIAGDELSMAQALASGQSADFFPTGLVSYLKMIDDFVDEKGSVWTLEGTGNPVVVPGPDITYPGGVPTLSNATQPVYSV